MRTLPSFVCIAVFCTSALAQSAESNARPRLRTPAELTAAPSQSNGAIITAPAGTHVLMQLVSPLDTESAVSESGVYLETIFPVVSDNRLAVPAGTRVHGIVIADKRAGRLSRAARFRIGFTLLVFANGYTVPIQGALQSIPGSTSARANPKQSSVSRVDQIDKTLPAIGAGALAGGVIGSVRHTGIGTWRGAALGAALATGAVLITRGDSIHWPAGTTIEMVLTEPVNIDDQQISEALNMRAPRLTAVAPPPDENTAVRRPPEQRRHPLTEILAGELLRSIVR
jgi:hypothetical protein